MSTWRRRKQTRRKLRYCKACNGTGKTQVWSMENDDEPKAVACFWCKGTGRKLTRGDERRAEARGRDHESDCDCATCRINDSLGYDADVGDPSQYCKHGTFIGSDWGPEYLCGRCEDGVGVCADCGIDLLPPSMCGAIPAGYGYLGTDDTPGRYSETYHLTLCALCEDARNAVVADRFRLMEAMAVAAVAGYDTIVLHEIARENVVQALHVADKMGWVR